MIHHHPMIHFCNINNLKNADYFMKQLFLNTCIYSPPTVKIWQGLDKLQVQCISIKSGCFADLVKKCPTTQYTHVLGISQWNLIQIFWDLKGRKYLYYKDLLYNFCTQKTCSRIWNQFQIFQCINSGWPYLYLKTNHWTEGYNISWHW